MEFLIKASQLMLSLSILVVLHELGHFIPARLFGTRVEKFYLFFDAGFSLFKYKKGDTEYGIGWLPLGGYVKIAGMIDESMDTAQLATEPQPWEFRSKPAWQRLVIMLGGVTVNFFLGLFLYGMVLWGWGEVYLPNDNVKYGIYVDSIGQKLGLQEGDHILQIGEKEFDKFSRGALIQGIVIDGAKTITVRRDGNTIDVDVPPNMVQELSSYKNQNNLIFDARTPFVVGQVAEGLPADKAGILIDDEIISLNGTPTPYFNQFQDLSRKLKSQEVTVGFIRNKKDTMNVDLTTTENGTIGVARYSNSVFFDIDRQDYTLAEAIPAGAKKGWNVLSTNVIAIGKMFTGDIKVSDSLGGFGSIGRMFAPVWDWERFWTMTAALSLILAFMNLLPIPALDGGHVMFLIYEVISGRKPSDKFMEYATMVGMVLVLGLVLYANGLDLWRWIQGQF